MSNFNEELDEILHKITGSKNVYARHSILENSRQEAKAAIIALIQKEVIVDYQPRSTDEVYDRALIELYKGQQRSILTGEDK